MKKNLFAILAVGVLVISGFGLTSCGSTSAVSGDNSVAEEATTSNNLISWMKDGKYSYDYTMTTTTDGKAGTATKGSIAMDGTNMSTTLDTEISGQSYTTRMVTKDGKSYVINDNAKTVTVMSTSSAEQTNSVASSNNGLKDSLGVQAKTGEGEFQGKTYKYQEYNNDDFTSRFYLDDNDQVVGFETTTETNGSKTDMVYVISNAKNTVEDSQFDIPTDGYTTTSL